MSYISGTKKNMIFNLIYLTKYYPLVKFFLKKSLISHLLPRLPEIPVWMKGISGLGRQGKALSFRVGKYGVYSIHSFPLSAM